jgi:hypothetical protein
LIARLKRQDSAAIEQVTPWWQGGQCAGRVISLLAEAD